MELMEKNDSGIQAGEIAEIVLQPGAHYLSAALLAQQLMTDVTHFNISDRLFGITGTFRGKRISIAGILTDILGEPTEKLYTQYGVKTIIHYGSGCGVSGSVRPGDIVIADSAARILGSDEENIPARPVATADPRLLETAKRIAGERNMSFRSGAVASPDFAYYSLENTNWEARRQIDEKLRKLGYLMTAVSAESLYQAASVCGGRAVSILLAYSHLDKQETLGEEEEKRRFAELLELALDIAWNCTD